MSQGVTTVVGGLGTRLALQGLQGLIVGPGLILSRGTPVRTFELFGGLAGVPGRQGLGALLVRPPPEILPTQGLRLGRRHLEENQNQQGAQPATAKGQGRQG